MINQVNVVSKCDWFDWKIQFSNQHIKLRLCRAAQICMNIRLEFQKHFISWKASTLPNKVSKESFYSKKTGPPLQNSFFFLSPPPPQKKEKCLPFPFL